jgi:hypothetical protein
MTRLHAAIVLLLLGAAACADSNAQSFDPPRTLAAFRSEGELAAFLRQRVRLQRTRQETALYEMPMPAPASSTDQVVEKAPGGVAPEPTSAAGESITNTQHAGVDEGGIVKVHGEFLVMLRRGRLFTVRVGGGDLDPISAVDAFGPEMDPGGTWYDELLVSGSRVVVIGFSYERGGTELGLFDIDDRGHLEYRATYHLRSNDYYSSRNYASRLIGDKLILYTPLHLSPSGDDVFAAFPAIRRWRPGATDDEFQRIVPATRVYRPGRHLDDQDATALHTVTVCDLAAGDMSCEGTAVLGPPGRVFYVSPSAVYVWVTDWTRDRGMGRAPSMLYRLPLEGSAPTAMGVEGVPVDQFSFLEGEDDHLNVVVRSGGAGEAMWGSEISHGGVSLMRVALRRFGDGGVDAPRSSYRALPTPRGSTFQNRFVGDHLLYGTGSGWGAPEDAGRKAVYATRYAGGGVVPLVIPHGVDRIEAMGGDAVVVGTDGRDLHFTGIDLNGLPRVAQHYVRENASQGEMRSHGFFYRPDGPESGTIGLPVRGEGQPGQMHLVEGSASITFIRNEGEAFRPLGELAARADGEPDDGCRASCVDWYGNARPIFLRGRTFALLGYEIVEGVVDDGRIRETRRVSFAPEARRLSAR